MPPATKTQPGPIRSASTPHIDTGDTAKLVARYKFLQHCHPDDIKDSQAEAYESTGKGRNEKGACMGHWPSKQHKGKAGEHDGEIGQQPASMQLAYLSHYKSSEDRAKRAGRADCSQQPRARTIDIVDELGHHYKERRRDTLIE